MMVIDYNFSNNQRFFLTNLWADTLRVRWADFPPYRPPTSVRKEGARGVVVESLACGVRSRLSRYWWRYVNVRTAKPLYCSHQSAVCRSVCLMPSTPWHLSTHCSQTVDWWRVIPLLFLHLVDEGQHKIISLKWLQHLHLRDNWSVEMVTLVHRKVRPPADRLSVFP